MPDEINPFYPQKPTPASLEKMEEVRAVCSKTLEVLKTIKASREVSLAITKLEECSLWAHKAICFTQEAA